VVYASLLHHWHLVSPAYYWSYMVRPLLGAGP